MSINDANINTTVYDTIRNILINKVFVTEGGNKRKAGVEAQYNDTKVATPQIVIIPADISENEYRFGGKYGKKFINISIECYYPNTYGVDSMADQIKELVAIAFDEKTVTGMDLVGISENYGFVNANEAKFHLKTITFTFIRE